MGLVELGIRGHRADLRLNRPDVLNAMSFELFDELGKAADEIAGAPDVRVVVVGGRGRSFSSGIDTTSFNSLGGGPGEMIERAQAGFRKLATLPMPTIASVQGHAYGAGMQLALGCDIRVVARDASLGLLEHEYGILPDLGGTQRLTALVGPGMAKKMIWTAERIDGEEAGARGIAEVVTDAGELEATVDALAERIAGAPPLAVRAVKKLVDSALRFPLDEAMDHEAMEQARLLASRDFTEALTAFIEKRPPDFEGE